MHSPLVVAQWADLDLEPMQGGRRVQDERTHVVADVEHHRLGMLAGPEALRLVVVHQTGMMPSWLKPSYGVAT